jgi:hypothetical protein
MIAMGAAVLLGGIARGAMAVIFAESAVHALRDVAGFAGAVAGYRVLPGWAEMPAAWGVPVASAVAGLLLVAPWVSGFGCALGLGLLAVFTAAIWINLRRGRVRIDCGCGGAGGTISRALLWRNGVLMAGLVAAGFAPSGGFAGFDGLVVMAGGAAALAALYFAAGQLMANRAFIAERLA